MTARASRPPMGIATDKTVENKHIYAKYLHVFETGKINAYEKILITNILRIFIHTLTPPGEAHCSWLCINKLSLTHQTEFGFCWLTCLCFKLSDKKFV
jgi:hypothetical protein